MSAITITVLETIGPGRYVLPCALCRGTGHKPGYKSDIACEVCTGKGVVAVSAAAPFVPCRLCGGSGNKPGYKPWVACDACQGVGAQPLTGALEVLR